MTDYLIHFLIGLLGAGAGYAGAKFCPHTKHQFAVAAIIVAIETVATVRIVG